MRRLLFRNMIYFVVGRIVNVVIFAVHSCRCAVYFKMCGQRWIRLGPPLPTPIRTLIHTFGLKMISLSASEQIDRSREWDGLIWRGDSWLDTCGWSLQNKNTLKVANKTRRGDSWHGLTYSTLYYVHTIEIRKISTFWAKTNYGQSSVICWWGTGPKLIIQY